MATQTRRTTQRSARFFRATGKAYMVTACCGLILLSAVAAHAARSQNGMPYNGMPYNGMPFQGLLMQGLPAYGVPATGSTVQTPPAPTVPQDSLPWTGLSQRPLGKP